MSHFALDREIFESHHPHVPMMETHRTRNQMSQKKLRSSYDLPEGGIREKEKLGCYFLFDTQSWRLGFQGACLFDGWSRSPGPVSEFG